MTRPEGCGLPIHLAPYLSLGPDTGPLTTLPYPTSVSGWQADSAASTKLYDLIHAQDSDLHRQNQILTEHMRGSHLDAGKWEQTEAAISEHATPDLTSVAEGSKKPLPKVWSGTFEKPRRVLQIRTLTLDPA